MSISILTQSSSHCDFGSWTVRGHCLETVKLEWTKKDTKKKKSEWDMSSKNCWKFTPLVWSFLCSLELTAVCQSCVSQMTSQLLSLWSVLNFNSFGSKEDIFWASNQTTPPLGLFHLCAFFFFSFPSTMWMETHTGTHYVSTVTLIV